MLHHICRILCDHHSSSPNDSNIEIFYEYVSYEKQNVTTYGPAANAGVRFGVGNKTKNIEILLSYMKGINDNKPNSYALQAVFNF